MPYANIPNPPPFDFTGTANRAVTTDGSGNASTSSNTTDTEIGYVHGVTSAIQTQLNAKQATITTLAINKGGTNSGTALNNNRVMQSAGGAIVEATAITASRALVSDANGIPVHATTTSTEIGYVNGVTSAIQTQLNTKQTKSSSVIQAVRVAVASPVTVAAATDYHIISKLTVPGAVEVDLPAGADGQMFIVTDGTGDAATHNVTVVPHGVETINGGASYVVSTNSQSVIMQFSTTFGGWITLGV